MEIVWRDGSLHHWFQHGWHLHVVEADEHGYCEYWVKLTDESERAMDLEPWHCFACWKPNYGPPKRPCWHCGELERAWGLSYLPNPWAAERNNLDPIVAREGE
ncbi:MAG: hypothetical protein AAF581_11060 [Planctomycetota bacterium]